MKSLIAILALICITGCSLRDGAASSAAYVGTVFDSMIGSHGTYDNNKRYWGEKFKEDKLSETIHIIPGDNSTSVHNPHSPQYQSSRR